MMFRVLELCLTLIFVVLTLKEIVIPLMLNKPLFPMLRKTAGDYREEKAQTQKKEKR